ncbi:MAG: S8 family serine peptidase, partial [Chloroflexales bacterium]|nr:S8 family serine peptidase [Chloroflexales bacterium]
MYKQQLLIRPIFLIALLSLVFVSAAVAHPMPQATVDEPSPFRATPDTLLAENVPLGQKRQIQFVLNNGDSVPHTPVLYKARGGSPDGAMMQQADAPQPQHVPLPEQTARIDPAIADDIAAAPDGQAEFLVFLNEQPDLSAAYAIENWEERGWFVYRTLHNNAERKQRSLRAWLDARGVPYNPLWIVNAIVVHGSSADVQALAARADVALVRANHAVSLDTALMKRPMTFLQQQNLLANAPSSCQADERGICWNILQVGAERVWSDFGVSGEGITVANIDSGVDFDHPALLQQYRGYQSPGNVDHAYSWFAPQGRSDIPVDSHWRSHGTHTMGTMVGRGDGSANQPAVGVAPGARWIAAQGCKNTECFDSDLLESAQWMLAPTDPYGQAPRPDLRPHVINNSWAGPGGDKSYAGYITAWRAAGIFPVFAAGNNRNSTCSTIGSPGDYANVVAVGSTTLDKQISDFSSTGPAKNGRLKPDITAPGSDVFSTVSGDSLNYGPSRGTSMAAPHIAGVVALLMAANPALIGDYDAIYSILTETATPMTDSRFSGSHYAACAADSQLPNNIFGHGLVDAYAAVAQAQVDVPWLELPTDLPAIAPGASLPISVTVDARRVPGPGTYQARLLIGVDDLGQPPLGIDVTMTIFSDDKLSIVQGSVADTETGEPIKATVTVSDGPTITTDIMGKFTVTLPGRGEPYTF